jgi:hypothetical protein
VHPRPGQKRRPTEVGRAARDDHSGGRRRREVRGPNKSEDDGEQAAAGPDRAKAARVETNFRREP